jgi:4-amino-4-deoxy-L-arabinose transferase-like glycosyltransferase
MEATPNISTKILIVIKRSYVIIILGSILLFAFFLRISHQVLLPYFFTMDEYLCVKPSLYMLQTGSLDPHLFMDGLFIQELTTGVYWCYFHILSLHKGIPYSSLIAGLSALSPILYKIGRYVSSVFDLFNIVIIYVIGKRLFNKEVGLIAALLTALNPLHFELSHEYKVDTALTFFVLLSFYFSLKIKEDNKVRWYTLSGIFSGLAIATKYNLIALVPPIIAGWLYYRKTEVNLRPRYFLLIIITFASFFIASPSILIDIHGFIESITYEFINHRSNVPYHDWIHTRFLYQFIFEFPFRIMLPTAYILSLIGIYKFARARFKDSILFLSYPVAYFTFATSISRAISQAGYAHLFLTIIPFLTLSASYAFVWLIKDTKGILRIVVVVFIIIERFAFISNDVNVATIYPEIGQWVQNYTYSYPGTRILTMEGPYFVSPNNIVLRLSPSANLDLRKEIRDLSPDIIMISNDWYLTYTALNPSMSSLSLNALLSTSGYSLRKTFEPKGNFLFSGYVFLCKFIDKTFLTDFTVNIFIKNPSP